MNNLLNIKTPAEDQAKALKSDFGLSNHGFRNLRKVYWNLPTESLYEEAVFRGEGHISHEGPMIVTRLFGFTRPRPHKCTYSRPSKI